MGVDCIINLLFKFRYFLSISLFNNLKLLKNIKII